MSLLNHAKLGLILLVVVGLLGAATQAHADAGVSAADSQPAITAPGIPPVPIAGATTAVVTPPSSGADVSPSSTGTDASPTTSGQTGGQPVSATPATAAATAPTAQSSPDAPTAAQSSAAHEGATPPQGTSPPSQNPGPGNTAALSNTTTQIIWQVQSSGCRIHCHGTSQTQTATQQSATVQAAPAALPVTAGSAPPIGAGDGGAAVSSAAPASSSDGSQITPGITQTQLGCLQYCFGSTTLGLPDQQLTEAALNELLAELEAFVPPMTTRAPTPATDVNVVDQTTTQFQDGSGGDGQSAVGGQAQTATQTAGTVQILPSSPAAQLQAIVMGDPSVATMLNQTLQGIWQLQIGCIFDCSQTQQDQQAQQSSTSVQVILPLPGGATPTTSAASSATGFIWQFQVGCLLWCYDAVEVQTASSDQSSIVIVPTPSPPPPPVTGGTPDPGGQTPLSGSSPGSVAPTSTSTSGAATVTSPVASTVTAPANRPVTAATRPAPSPVAITAEPSGGLVPQAIARFTPEADGTTLPAAAAAPFRLGSHYGPASPGTWAVTLAMPTTAHQAERTRHHGVAVPTTRPRSQAAVTSAGPASSDTLLLLLIAAVGLGFTGFVCQSIRR
jgi:hypothetical protein